jgi:hypothetical protein
MFKVICTALLLFLLAAGTGCSGVGALEATHLAGKQVDGAFILYSLDGDRYPGEPVPEGGKLLHGWLILKACPIDDVATRRRIFRAFDDGIDDAPGGVPVDCFTPRHAISVESNGVRMEYLICFQCFNWYSYEDGKSVGGGRTSRSPASTFDEILSACSGKTNPDDK